MCNVVLIAVVLMAVDHGNPTQQMCAADCLKMPDFVFTTGASEKRCSFHITLCSFCFSLAPPSKDSVKGGAENCTRNAFSVYAFVGSTYIASKLYLSGSQT